MKFNSVNPREIIHITPNKDLYSHRLQSDCICKPKIIYENEVIIVMHNSFDHREFSEHYQKDCVNPRWFA